MIYSDLFAVIIVLIIIIIVRTVLHKKKTKQYDIDDIQDGANPSVTNPVYASTMRSDSDEDVYEKMK